MHYCQARVVSQLADQPFFMPQAPKGKNFVIRISILSGKATSHQEIRFPGRKHDHFTGNQTTRKERIKPGRNSQNPTGNQKARKETCNASRYSINHKGNLYCFREFQIP
jgi:hypothetical protein